MKYLVERYTGKKDWNRKQSSGSLWKPPFYDELDAVLGNRDTVTFQHVAQVSSLSTESSSSSAANTSNPPSSTEDSPPSKERNSKSNNDGNVAVASKQLRRKRKKRRAPTAEQQGTELEEESQMQATILKSVTEQGTRMTAAIEKMQDSKKQQMETMTQFMGAMIGMMQNNAANN